MQVTAFVFEVPRHAIERVVHAAGGPPSAPRLDGRDVRLQDLQVVQAAEHVLRAS